MLHDSTATRNKFIDLSDEVKVYPILSKIVLHLGNLIPCWKTIENTETEPYCSEKQRTEAISVLDEIITWLIELRNKLDARKPKSLIDSNHTN